MNGELEKKSDSKAWSIKYGGTTRSQTSQEESKEALKKEIAVTDSDEPLITTHKKRV